MVSSVTDPVTGATGYTYRLSGERKTMTLPCGGTWTYTYIADINAAGGSSLGCNETLPKDDPNSITSTLASITDDQGRQVRYLTGYTGQLMASLSDQAYDAQGNAVSYVLTTYNLPTGDEYNNAPPSWVPAGEMEGVTTTFAWLDKSGSYPTWHSRLLSSNAYTYNDLGERLTNTVTTASVNADGSPQYGGGSPAYGSAQYDAFYNSAAPATNQVTTTRTEAYTYDSLSRLGTVDYGDGQTQSYGFDAMGNRLSRQDSVSGTTSYAYNAANMLLSTTGAGADTYTSDADGNTLTGGGRANAWDSQNRLASCAKSTPTGTGGTATFNATYAYGANGLRRRASSFTTTRFPGRITPPPPSPRVTDYAYDGTMLVREGSVSGRFGRSGLTPATATATYLIGARGPEYRRDDTAKETDSQGNSVTKARWYVYDGLGSVVGEVDPGGNLTSSPKYDVYGAVRANGGSATSRQGFVGSLGHVSDAETGLIYMQARYYDPSVGRFLSQDPGLNGTNWFVYCNNNPVNSVDADGKVAAWLAAVIVGAFIGMGIYLMECAYKHETPTASGFLKAAILGAVGALIAFVAFVGVGSAAGALAIASFANGALCIMDLILASVVGFDVGMLTSIAGRTLGPILTHTLGIEMALAESDSEDAM